MPRGAKPGENRGQGRPSGSPTDIKALARMYTTDCLKALVGIVHNSKNEGNKIAAATALLDRAHGKPTNMVATDPDMPMKLIVSWESNPPQQPKEGT